MDSLPYECLLVTDSKTHLVLFEPPQRTVIDRDIEKHWYAMTRTT